MASFNTMPALSSDATPNVDALGLNAAAAAAAAAGQVLGMDAFDHDLGFDGQLLDGTHNSLPGLHFAPAYDFETFSTTFEDPFSYSSATAATVAAARAYDAGAGGVDAEGVYGASGDDDNSPQELDNKLLSFGQPLTKASLVDENGRLADIGMSAELYGMFFVAEDVFGVSDSSSANRPLELTCYRRNLWQCSGQITLPRHKALTHVVVEQGRQVPVLEMAASITAVESIEGKPTEIISIPWKSGGGNNGGGGADEPPRVAAAPPLAPLDLSSGQEVDGHRVSVPVAWKRLQFKHATANNGRRKGLQQHYVVQINLLAKTGETADAAKGSGGGDWLKIAEVQSGPVIVRGRSPRNFDNRKDVPLSGERKPERRGTDASNGSGSGGNGVKTQDRDLTQNIRYHSLSNIQNTFASDWPTPFTSPPTPYANKKRALSPTPNPARPPVPSWGVDNSNNSSSNTAKHTATLVRTSSGSGGSAMRTTGVPPTLPINLSLSEDERSPNRSGSADDLQSPRLTKSAVVGMRGGTGGGVDGPNAGGTPETADMLYEYFPLSLDDWMHPVDAIYRPHVVHHTVVPPEVKAQQTRSKTKRYFAAE